MYTVYLNTKSNNHPKYFNFSYRKVTRDMDHGKILPLPFDQTIH